MLLEDIFINIDVETIPKFTKISGISFYDRQQIIKQINVGDILQLKRDYKNQYDKFAIGIYTNDNHIGWIPKHISQKLAWELDCGLNWVVKVMDITGRDKETQGVNIQLLYIENKLRG